MYWGKGMLAQNLRGDHGTLSYPPPPDAQDFEQFFQQGFFRGLPSSPRPQKLVSTLVFTVVFWLLLGVSRTARCDAYHTSLPSTGDFL